MSNHKTIKINPELFTLTKSKKTKQDETNTKTKKNTGFKPNNLKNKLLERIKAHKNKETNLGTASSNNVKTDDFDVQSNEFDDSMAYLSSLAKQSKETSNKNAYVQNTQTSMKGGRNKTLKNYHASPSQSFHVELDLPDELKETPMVFHTPTRDEAPITLKPPNEKYMVDNQVPYGCLKGGQKPTFKAWNRTLRSPPAEPSPLTIYTSPPVASPTTTTRETKMKELKEKMRRKQQSLESAQPSSAPKPTSVAFQPSFDESSIIISNPAQIGGSVPVSVNIMSHQIPVAESSMVGEDTSTMQMTQTNGPKRMKKTIKRTYTLGKSKIHKRVGVLIKDKNTRKRVLQAQRDIKRHGINDVKQYLRTHGLMKAGSSAPNDIVRKIYESAMLSGEVTNQDQDILLQNFLKEKEE
jgi:hypothetical protein